MLNRFLAVSIIVTSTCLVPLPTIAADPGNGDLCPYYTGNGGAPDAPEAPPLMVPCVMDGHPWSEEHGCWYEQAPVDNVGPVVFRPRGGYGATMVTVAVPLRGAIVASPVPPAPAPDPPGQISYPRGFNHPGGAEPGMWVRCWKSAGGGVGVVPAIYRFAWWITTGGGIDPADLARRSVAQLGIQAPLIGMTGGSPPEGMQIVGLPAWMWITNPGPQTTGTVSTTVSDGGTSVTLTGSLDRTVWSMGDGSQVTCKGSDAPYEAYDRKYWNQPSPSCGYTYTKTSAGQPNLAYTVTVTAYWTIGWQSNDGQSGTIPFSLSSSIPKQVGQIETIVTGGGS